MSDNVENLILEHLRGMRGSQDRIEAVKIASNTNCEKSKTGLQTLSP